MKLSTWLPALGFLALFGPVALALPPAAAVDPAAAEFFEREVRPILVERCQSCHGSGKAQGGLRLTARELLLKGGDSGPALVPGKPEQSLLIKALEYRGDLKMPPTGKLPDAEVARLKRWIAAGAPWPAAAKPTPAAATGEFQITPAQRRWWAFQRVRPVTVPTLPGSGAPLSPIDAFVRAEQKAHGITPAPRADKRTLIRRATYDLTGLPPTPDEVAAFLGDSSPAAFTKVVDRLLASPAYGERWGRHWLDVVRYADYHDGNPQTRTASCEPLEAWRYRDWVVNALNRDLPYDQFIVHQIAGDLLPVPDGQEFYADGLVATTFLTNGSWDRGDADKEKMVSDMVDDQVDTVGKAFLGLTLGCARCHNHKFDPVSQADYYGLAGIFYSTHILKDIGAKGGEYTLNRIPLVPKAYLARREEQRLELDKVNAALAELDKKTPPPAADDPARMMLAGRRTRLQAEYLPAPPLAEAAQEGGTANGLFPKIQDVPIHIRGSYTRLGPVVPRHMPVFLAGNAQPPITSGSGRLELARWIASKDNPLTARVIVNRIWQGHFGQGLVRTPNNFGLRSEPPSHPALLDWLASVFAGQGLGSRVSGIAPNSNQPPHKVRPIPDTRDPKPWSLKDLHRLIMLSETYQQASVVPRAQLARDPENRWLGRFVARRLEAEAVRDGMLSVSGLLETTPGGPASANLGIARRSLYVQTARWDRSSFATLFDAANPDASEERRNVSTVAPQALFLLNHEFTLGQAKLLAERLAREVPRDEGARIQRAYQLLFARPATAAEVEIARKFLAGAGQPETAWLDLAHVLLCSNEFVYLD